MPKVTSHNKTLSARICIIIDLEGFPLASLLTNPCVITLATRLSKTFSANYPEILEKVVVINSGILFSSVFKLLTPILNKGTIEKVNIPGSEWKENLRSIVPSENLPKQYGGDFEGQFADLIPPWESKQE